MISCRNCGADLNDNDKFCYKCGAEVMNTCFKCGAVIKSNSDYCWACGANLNALAQINTTSYSKNNTRNKLKHFVSWLVFYISTMVLTYIGYISTILIFFAFEKVEEFSIVALILLILFLSSLLLAIIIAPFGFGATALIMLSEKIYPSASGTRYKAISIFRIITALMELALISFSIKIGLFYYYSILFYVAVLWIQKELITREE